MTKATTYFRQIKHTLDLRRRTKTFKKIAGWKAIRLLDTAVHEQVFRIEDADGNYMAFLSKHGALSLNTLSNSLKPSNSKLFDYHTELEQAVRYTYLIYQQHALTGTLEQPA